MDNELDLLNKEISKLDLRLESKLDNKDAAKIWQHF